MDSRGILLFQNSHSMRVEIELFDRRGLFEKGVLLDALVYQLPVSVRSAQVSCDGPTLIKYETIVVLPKFKALTRAVLFLIDLANVPSKEPDQTAVS